MNSEPPVIVGFGEALWDIFGNKAHLGGAPANFACHVASLGGHPFLVSSIGDDSLGKKTTTILKDRKVDTTFLQIHPSRPTGEVRISLDKQSVPEFHFMENPAWDEIISDPAQLALARRCSAVNYGTLAQQSARSIASTREFLQNCPSRTLRLFDMNLRGNHWSPALILESLELATALKCNEDEVKILAQVLGLVREPLEMILHEALERFHLQFIALTLGSEGSLIVTPAEENWCPPETVDVIDTTGAGDSFVATLVIGFLAGQIPLPKLHRHASRVAAFVCTQQGATPRLPKELASFFKKS